MHPARWWRTILAARCCVGQQDLAASDVPGAGSAAQYAAVPGQTPEHIGWDNGPEFVARKIQRWLDRASVGTLYINRPSPGRTCTWNRSTAGNS